MKIIVNGALGRMGKELSSLAAGGYMGSSLAAMVDVNAEPSDNIYRDINDFDSEADVIVDFSHHTAVKSLIPYAVKRNIPVIIATTGHDENEREIIEDAAQKIPVFLSANMSVGIAALCSFAKCAAALFPDADIEIVETHHVNKLDAPSGTALMIAEEIRTVRPEAVINCGRSGMKKREKNEIGISSVRLSNVVGEHEVMISTGTQTLKLRHEAHSRSLFAEGAITAAVFIKDKPAGLYSVNDMVKI